MSGLQQMRASYIMDYGGIEVLQYGKIDKTEPADQAVLVKVRSSSLNPVDYKFRNGLLKNVVSSEFPRVLGSDFAGEVEYTNNPRLRKGDKVFGFLKTTSPGAHAEYLSAKPDEVCKLPKNFEWKEAAVLPLVGCTAIDALKEKGKIRKGHKVLINGAGGGVGSFAVQYAKYMGAEVTGVCSSSKVDLCKTLGCLSVIDYTGDPISGRYDIILDAVGNLKYPDMKKHLNNKGAMVTLGFGVSHFIRGFFSRFTSKRFYTEMIKPKYELLEEVKKLAENGAVKPVVQSEYSLSEIKEAYKELEQGHVAGKIAISVYQEPIV